MGHGGKNCRELQVRKILAREQLTLDLVLEAVPELMRSGKYEETIFGLLLFNGMDAYYSKESFEQAGTWFSIGITNWAHADTLGMYVLPKFLSKDIVTVDDFRPWITSPHRFQRRCVPVTLIKRLKMSEDIASLLVFIEPLMTDSAREVHQGTGWFLREVWKLDNLLLEEFLLRWKDLAPRLIIQYACEKMTREEKMKFKRNKQSP